MKSDVKELRCMFESESQWGEDKKWDEKNQIFSAHEK